MTKLRVISFLVYCCKHKQALFHVAEVQAKLKLYVL